MNKKNILIIILVLTSLAVGIILLFTTNKKYKNLIINDKELNNIIKNRNTSTSISLEKIKFNDYNLLIDEENSIIYYSVVDSKNKYNPSVEYTTNIKAKVAISKELNDKVLEQTDSIKIILYNDKSYRTYNLVATKFPILNIVYTGDTNKKRIDANIEIFDNHIYSPRRVLKSAGSIKIIEKNKEYTFSLTKESPGNNKRENYISIFGMEKRDEYLIKAVNDIYKEEKYVQLFINNEYIGVYSLGPKERRIDNFERNRENNK